MRSLFYLFICISTFHLALADSLVDLMKKSKPKIKNEYPPEGVDGGTHIKTFNCGSYRFILNQTNQRGEGCGENEVGNEFTFTSEVKDPKNKKKYSPIQFSTLFKPEKIDTFNKLLEDSVLAVTTTATYSNLLEDKPKFKTIDSCGYSFTKAGMVIVFYIDIDWDKATKSYMEEYEIEDYASANNSVTREMCSTGSFVIPWNIVAEYLKE
jgi:hypothetical protein